LVRREEFLMKKKLMISIYILISIPVLLFFLYNLSRFTRNIKEHYCLQNKYVLFYDNFESITLSKKEKGGGMGAIRGKIEKFLLVPIRPRWECMGRFEKV